MQNSDNKIASEYHQLMQFNVKRMLHDASLSK
uniref:Uncharacterized protein n=1 Tax=Arundo donax TaxID=35708 RepID=A0A0A9E2T4_ARUDO